MDKVQKLWEAIRDYHLHGVGTPEEIEKLYIEAGRYEAVYPGGVEGIPEKAKGMTALHYLNAAGTMQPLLDRLMIYEYTHQNLNVENPLRILGKEEWATIHVHEAPLYHYLLQPQGKTPAEAQPQLFSEAALPPQTAADPVTTTEKNKPPKPLSENAQDEIAARMLVQMVEEARREEQAARNKPLRSAPEASMSAEEQSRLFLRAAEALTWQETSYAGEQVQRKSAGETEAQFNERKNLGIAAIQKAHGLFTELGNALKNGEPSDEAGKQEVTRLIGQIAGLQVELEGGARNKNPGYFRDEGAGTLFIRIFGSEEVLSGAAIEVKEMSRAMLSAPGADKIIQASVDAARDTMAAGGRQIVEKTVIPGVQGLEHLKRGQEADDGAKIKGLLWAPITAYREDAAHTFYPAEAEKMIQAAERLRDDTSSIQARREFVTQYEAFEAWQKSPPFDTGKAMGMSLLEMLKGVYGDSKKMLPKEEPEKQGLLSPLLDRALGAIDRGNTRIGVGTHVSDGLAFTSQVVPLPSEAAPKTSRDTGIPG